MIWLPPPPGGRQKVDGAIALWGSRERVLGQNSSLTQQDSKRKSQSILQHTEGSRKYVGDSLFIKQCLFGLWVVGTQGAEQ